MSHTIYASFENRDAAERAAARMRRKGLAFRFDLESSYDSGATLSLIFPYRPPHYTNEFINMPAARTLGSAVFPTDTQALSLYSGSETARVRITVDDEHLESAKSIIRNCGAYDLR